MKSKFETSPAWKMEGTAPEIEKQLNGFKFKGPGLYLTKIHTIIIIPLERKREEVWHQMHTLTERFEVLVFNCQWREVTFFSVISQIPARQDEI